MVTMYKRITRPEEIKIENLTPYLKQLPEVQYRPLVNSIEFAEIVKIFRGLPKLEYPIESAGELVEKLGGPNATHDIEGMKISPWRMVKYMPAYYFPIASVENFVEKMAELIRKNRKFVDVPKEIESIKRRLPKMKYPITSREMLLESLGSESQFQFQGKPVTPAEVIDKIPDAYFPIESEDDFLTKATILMATRPLLVKE